jgi:probable HAF family extracellular repeat protein
MTRQIVALACVWLMLSGGWAQQLIWLGQLPGGLESEALGVSADGTVVVGTAINADGFRRAFRWTAPTGMQDLGTLGGVLSIGNAISADGQTIVGYSSNQNGQLLAFRWRNGQMEPLRPLGNVVWSEAYGVSADGSVIAGHSWWGSNFRAARWQGNTVTNLGTLPGAIASRAWGVSGDGQVIVGAAFFASSGLPEARAVRWQGATIQQLGELAGYRRSWAFAASHDGSVIVGFAYADNESAPSTSIRWVNGQPQNLGWLPIGGADGSIAYGVSGDGAIVVGNSDGRAYRWTETHGMENLNAVYASLLADGSQLYSAQAISADGRFIVGRGRNAATNRTEAFLLDTATCVAHNGDVDRSGCIDDADLLAVLFAFGQTGGGLGRVDVNCDQRVDDADLLVVLFAFGGGC